MQYDKEKEIEKEKEKEIDKTINKTINVENASNKTKRKFKLSKIFSYLIFLISLIIIFFSSFYLVQTKILKKNYADIFGYTILDVKSGSMQKEIMIGDLVIVKILASEKNAEENIDNNVDKIKDNINVEDIITFIKEDYLITHRVLEKRDEDLITKGDANNTEDDPILYKDIVGKVVKIIPNIAIWKKVFAEKSVLVPLLSGTILLVITLMIDDGKETKKEINGKKKNKIQKGKRFK